MRFMHITNGADSRDMAQQRTSRRKGHAVAAGAALVVALGACASTQSVPPTTLQAPAQAAVDATPADYVIGPEDVLSIVFWREKDLSAEVVVRPDGKITLPLINDVQAAGLTTDQLRQAIVEAAGRYVEDPSATIVVKQINSRRVFITGEVGRSGFYPLSTSTTVLQALSMAGGVAEWAKKDRILIVRKVGSQTKTFKFNYKDILKGKGLEQNIELKPGDTIIVP